MLIDLLVGNPMVRRLADAGLVRYAHRRTATLDGTDVPAVQERTLLDLVRRARATRFGRDHRFEQVRNVEEYQAAVPVRTYEDFWRTYWQDTFPRLEGTTWPDLIPYFALSSGTTTGTTKYLPISKEMLASNRKAAYTTVALVRHAYPDGKLFNGRFFFLGGNTELRRESNGSRSGDLSAISTIEFSPLGRPYSFPPLELAAIGDWTVKVRRLAEASAKQPITAISGVPAWLQSLFRHLKEVTGKRRIADVWPMLRLVVHGGTKFDAYRAEFQDEVGPDCHFAEVYPASEGFVATEDPRYQLLRVVPDHGIFFEFVLMTEFEDGKPKTDRPVRHTLATAETGVEYAVAVTTCAGLWSYLIGDTVTFERREPPLIRFTGRTKYYLSAFGEHLIEDEITMAVAEAAGATGARTGEWHVGPVFPTDPARPGHHRYLIEFPTPPTATAAFVDTLDTTLRRLNEDYEAHRHGDLSMLRPEVLGVKPGGFERWMIAHGKRPPQHKVPKMDNGGEQTKAITAWLREHGELSP
ncbi:MAG TPA: GH3 auxin-responsive promoter family protein [Gemmataceae bacterium]|nr:GH3 auxin-responsive promoter family protein [Gemmataceae bacterium]